MKTSAMLAVMLFVSAPVFAQNEVPVSNAPVASAPAAKTAKAPKTASAKAQVDQQIAQMHQQLSITPAQQPAWDAFAQVMRDNLTSINQAYKARRASLATMSAPDNMRNFAQIEQERTDGIQKLAASFQTLYDGLSDDQKKTADAIFRQHGHHATGQGKAHS